MGNWREVGLGFAAVVFGMAASLAAEPADTVPIPLGGETTVDDTARAFVYLATAEATTGCVITVDGGNAAAFPR